MKISSKTKISVLIQENEAAIEVIASINKNFNKLRNPFLRKLLAPRVSIADAAKIGGVNVQEMLERLKGIGFELDSEFDSGEPTQENSIDNKSIHMKKDKVVDLDVRPILAGGEDPFKKIMAKLKTLNDGETLRIINTFEPIPLLNILKTKGYEYETERPENGVVHTYLQQSGKEVEDTADEAQSTAEPSYDSILEKYKGLMTEIDVRDLEMPLPMVTILEALESVNSGHALFVNHKKLPQYLLPELKERDYKWVSKEIEEGDLKLIIFK